MTQVFVLVKIIEESSTGAAWALENMEVEKTLKDEIHCGSQIRVYAMWTSRALWGMSRWYTVIASGVISSEIHFSYFVTRSRT